MFRSTDTLIYAAIPIEYPSDFWHLVFFVAVYVTLPNEHLVFDFPTLVEMTEVYLSIWIILKSNNYVLYMPLNDILMSLISWIGFCFCHEVL